MSRFVSFPPQSSNLAYVCGGVRLALLLLLSTGLFSSGCGQSDAIVVIALHPQNAKILYISTNDYIYKSRDGGQTWENLSKGMTYTRVISMAIDPVYPATIYAGTKGDAVYKSYDGGQRWVSLRAGLDDVTISSVINQFVFDPTDNNHVFVATTMGVFESQNGGDQWQKRMDGMKEVLMVVALGLDPSRPKILYAGTSGGVYKTVSRGLWWERVNNGLVVQDVHQTSRSLGVTVIQVDPHAPNTVFAATLSGLYLSRDGGKLWKRIGESLPDQMISAMVLDRAVPNRVYIASRSGIHRSDDGGMTWKAMNEGLSTLNVRSLAQSPVDANVFYVGTNGSGLYHSQDGGATWIVLPSIRAEGAERGRGASG